MKFKNELIVICLILFVLITTSAVAAADNNTEIIDNNNDNILSIDGSNYAEILTEENQGSFADLDDKINGDSSTNIVLDKNYTYSSSDIIKDGILISKNNTVIDGQGHTVDAKGHSRIFNVTATTVTLKNIVFVNGNHNLGGAIRGYGDNLRIVNCTFIGNVAETWGGAVYSYPNSYAAFVNSTFIGNKAKYGGAVSTIYGYRQDLVNCNFDANNATYGGGLLIYGELGTTERPYDNHVNIRGCIFTNNEASNGDAICNYLSALINMTDSIIIGNQETLIDSWGRMFFADNNWWGNTIDDASIKPNITDQVTFTKWLYLDLVPNMDTSSATVCINSLYDGATGETGVYSTSKLPSINAKFQTVNATIDVNSADLDNSGNYELNFVLLGDSVLTVNCANSEVSKKIRVGGLKELEMLIRDARDNGVLKLDKDYVYTEGSDNKIGVSISEKNNLVIDGNGYTINGMGKSRVFYVYDDSESITFKNMRIVNGFTNDGVDGAGAYVYADNIKFINCTFINNTAIGYGAGGALHIHGDNVLVDDCRFVNNTHLSTSGGAVYWRGENATISNSIFEDNAADIRAGAVFIYDGGSIINSTFIHNRASEAGATYNYGTVAIDGCKFINNAALATTLQPYYGGGAVYATNTTITDSLFVNNTAVAGAAIVIASQSVSIERSIFVNNTATGSNGIVFGIVEGGKIINSIFLNNNVAYNSYVISTIWGKLQADYNWFGNTAKNYDRNYDVSNLAVMSRWLFLNATEPIYSADGKRLTTQFNLFAYDQNTKQIIRYDMDNLPAFNLTISTQNLTLAKDKYAPDEVLEGNVTYRIAIGEEGNIEIYDYKGTITAQYENVKYVLPFSVQQKTWFEANSTFELMKDEIKYLDFTLNPFESDYLPFLNSHNRLTYTINDTSVIKFNKTTGKITALKVGLATVTIKFDGKDVMGRDKYTPSSTTILVNVTKAETHIVVNIAPEQLSVGDSASLSASIYDYKNKTVHYVQVSYINNNPELLTGESVIKAIAEGLAKITVKFDGNANYLPCSLDLYIDVGRLNPHLSVSDDNISIKVSKDYFVAVYCDSSYNISYISNDTNVAVMDENGVHGIGEGVANITVNFAGTTKYRPATAYIIVNVTADKTYVDVNQTRTLLLSDEGSLNAIVRDIDGKVVSYYMNYTSNDTSVVTVNEHGTMTAVGEGVANITVTFNGRYEYLPSTANVIVTVGIGSSNIDVNSTMDIILKDKKRLNAKLNHDGKLNYTSSNPDVVIVDEYGHIYAKKIGKSTITITYEGSKKYYPCTANVTVSVLPIPTKIDVEKTFAWIIDGNGTIDATLNPIDAGSLTFKSNNESVVTVDEKGKVNATGVGKTTIFISFAGNENYLPTNETIEVSIYSSDIPTTIEVNKTFDLHVDDAIDMGAILNPSNAGELTYSSSNPDVVSVDENGKITAKKVGEANITIAFGGNNRYLANTTSVLVKVSLISTSIIANNNITVNLTEKADLDYVFSHPEAGQLKFIFGNIDVASIDGGKIQGDEVGKTTLTIKFEGNGKYAASNASIEINVVDVETSIDVADSINVNVTESTMISASLNPKEAGKLRFISNNKDIISVDGNGNVYGIKLGNGTVTIVFEGDGKYRKANKTVTVNVVDVETRINSDDYLEVNVTEKASIFASADPKQAGKLHFNTKDSDIISLDEKGNIKGLKVGIARVVISLDANGKYRQANATVIVNVVDVSTDIKVGSDSIELTYGESSKIDATLTPIEAKLVFASNDTNVVTVDENGNVKTIRPGVATIAVSYAGEGKYKSSSKNITVTVKRAPSSIAVNGEMSMEIGVGYTIKLDTNPLKMDVVYSSSDNNTVNIESDRFIFAYQKGSAIITVSFAGDEYYLPSNATINVTVKSRETEIRVNDSVVLGYGEEMDLEANLYHIKANSVMNGKLNYVSSDESIVEVDSEGKITALDVGKATINITYEGDKTFDPSFAVVNVEVTTRTTTVSLDSSSINLHVDDVSKISAKLQNGPNDYQLRYISSNPNIVRVNPLTGEITAVANGTSIITVSYAGDDDYHSSSANVSVTVSKFATHINAQTTYDMRVYDVLDLEASVTPNNGALIYVSGDEDVVTISNGKATAHKSGNAIVTIMFEGDRKYLPSQKQVIVSVSKIATSINLTDINLVTGEVYKLENLVVPSGVPTSARYYEIFSWDTEIFDVENGAIVAYQEGQDELYVEFKGNDVYLPSNATVKVTVVKKVLSAEDFNVTIDVRDDLGRVTFTAKLPEDVDEASGFFVNINGDTYGEYGNIIDGVATVTVDDLAPGDYKVTLRYTGDEKYASYTNNTHIHLGKYKIDKNNDISVLYTSKYYVVYTVHLTRDTQAMEGKKITFRFNGRYYYAYTNQLGYASVKIKLPVIPKKYVITAQFGDVRVSNKVTMNSVVVAKDLNVRKSSSSVKIKVSLKKVNKKYLKGKKLVLTFNGKKFTAKTNSRGVATFTISKNAYSKLKVGKKYVYKVTYLRDTVSKKITIR